MSKFPLFFSCDTAVALGNATIDGMTLFAKNSDREPNEAQYLQVIPPALHPDGEMLKLTYIEIPQIEHTHGVLISRPFWMWGAEMGVNDKGVAIGNEAVFTKEPYGKKPGLIGMDMLRLALERSATAEQALNVITNLLGEYGQGGNCGYKHKLYYHNSFIIADPKQAFVLETSGQHWAAKEIKDVYSISNGLTIEDNWDASSGDLVQFAREKGWCKRDKDFSFARCYSDFLFTHFSDCRKRRRRTLQALKANIGKIDVPFMMRLLRDHDAIATKDFRPDKGLSGATVCMHAGPGPIRGSQTVGSLISHLHPQHATHFVTGTAAPCTSIFKPVWLDAPPDFGAAPGELYDEASRFWRHETLHRQLVRDSLSFVEFEKSRDEFEQEYISRAIDNAPLPTAQRQSFSVEIFDNADKFEDKWQKHLETDTRHKSSFLYKSAWAKWNKEARLMLDGGAHESK